MLKSIFDKLLLDISNSSTLSSRQKKDLSKYVSAIEQFIDPLYKENKQAAESICNFLNCVIFESTRKDRSTSLATTARKGMLLSFRPFEQTYPELVTTAYEFGDILSALGI